MSGEAIEVRTAGPDEAEELAQGYEWLFAPPGSRPPDWDPVRGAGTLRRVMAAPDSTVLGAFDGATLVGLCTVYRDIDSVRFGQRAWVEDLAVHPDHRSRGIGQRLLDAAKDWARGQGATHLGLTSGPARVDAHRFYERERPSARSMYFNWRL